MRGDDERRYPPGVVPGAAGAIGAIAAAVLVVWLILGALLTKCARPEPAQMIPTPAPVTVSTATSSAAVAASQSVRVTIKRSTPPADGSQVTTSKASDGANGERSTAQQVTTPNVPNWGQDEITIEVAQTLGATSAAVASASVDHSGGSNEMVRDHGRLGVLTLTAPGVLAVDVEIARLDVPPWLIGQPFEVGLDMEGNLEHFGAGSSIGGKGFAFVGYWSRWNLSAQGVALGAGLRF